MGVPRIYVVVAVVVVVGHDERKEKSTSMTGLLQLHFLDGGVHKRAITNVAGLNLAEQRHSRHLIIGVQGEKCFFAAYYCCYRNSQVQERRR